MVLDDGSSGVEFCALGMGELQGRNLLMSVCPFSLLAPTFFLAFAPSRSISPMFLPFTLIVSPFLHLRFIILVGFFTDPSPAVGFSSHITGGVGGGGMRDVSDICVASLHIRSRIYWWCWRWTFNNGVVEGMMVVWLIWYNSNLTTGFIVVLSSVITCAFVQAWCRLFPGF